MKLTSSTIISVLILSISFFLYFSFSSCKKIEDPKSDRDSKDTITYDLLKTRIFIQFRDASTNELIIPDETNELSVKIIGKSKDAVVDIVGLKSDSFIAKQGFLSLGLVSSSEFIPSPESPISFTIVSELTKYLTSRKEINITSEGDYMLKVFMIDVDNPPDGVVIDHAYNVGVLINGVLQEDITVSTSRNEAKIVIPAGIKLIRDDSINLAGKLNVTLAYFNSRYDGSLAAAPGGIIGTVLNHNSTNTGVFFPASLIAFNITDSDNHPVSRFENTGLEITTTISKHSYNPVSASPIVAGDSVPLYTYLADTGLWKFDSWAYITDTLFNGLYSVVRTQGLDCVSYSWFESNNCNGSSKFKLSGACSQCGSVTIDGTVRKQADNSFVSSITVIGNGDMYSGIPFSTGNTPVYIDWDQGNECNSCSVNQGSSHVLIDNMCSQSQIEIPLQDNSPTTISITATFQGTCATDKNVLILPSYGVWIRPIDANCWRWVSMKNGVAQICDIVYGNTYMLGTYYDESWQEWEITVNEEQSYDFTIEFSSSICSDVFGIL